MIQGYKYKKVNDNLTIRLIKWYEIGILGCGKNSVPWIDLTKYDLLPTNVKEIQEEIVKGIKDIPQTPGGVASIMPYHINGKNILPYYVNDLEKYVPEKVRLTATTKWDIQNWLFKNVCDEVWGRLLAVRRNKENYWYGKNSNQCEWSTEKFPLLQNWIENLTIFEELGRVIIFKNTPGNSVPAHRDDVFVPHKNHFINFQLNKIRPTYVYDEVLNKKIHINSRAYMFNEHDIHGVDIEDTEEYTIRVDGRFTKEFCELIGLEDGVVWDDSCLSYSKVDTIKIIEP
jgi:hypothetical protein